MKIKFIGCLYLISFCLFYFSTLAATTIASTETSAGQKQGTGAKMNMPFIANEGQFSNKIKFYAKTFGGTVFVTDEGQWIYSLPQKEQHGPSRSFPHRAARGNKEEASVRVGETKGLSLKEELVGGRIKSVKGEGVATSKANYFWGKDEKKWKTNILTYAMVNLGEVYEGIELGLKAHGDNVEKLFYVKPGAKPETIKVKLSGARSLKITESGELAAVTDLGTVQFSKPVAYQEIDGKRITVAAAYELVADQPTTADSGQIYGFKLENYDISKQVVIDPLLYSTYLGGSGSDLGFAIKVDKLGYIYIAGVTMSADFSITPGAFDRSFNGGNTDFFISKISPAGSLIYSTFIGGNDIDHDIDAGELYVSGMTIDASGNVYMTGETFSADFPTTSGAFDRTINGGSDAFVLKLNPAGDQLIYSTFVGGSGDDMGAGIAVDAQGNAYVAGDTYSLNFPTTPGAFDTTFNYGGDDLFAIKLNSTGSGLVYSTYIGGSGWEDTCDIAIDELGNAYILGGGNSSNYPTTLGAYDRTYNDDSHYHDIYITKLNTTGIALIASTFLGGNTKEWPHIIALDDNGNVFISGATHSSNFPTTSGAYNRIFVEDSKGISFVSKFDNNLGSLLASTFISKASSVISNKIGNSGDVYVVGGVSSSSYPTTPGAYDTYFHGGVSYGSVILDDFCSSTGGCDGFVSKLDNNLTTLLASTFLGGSGNEIALDIALDALGKIYVVGITTSPDFPVKNAFSSSHNGSDDVFVTVLDSNLSADKLTPAMPWLMLLLGD